MELRAYCPEERALRPMESGQTGSEDRVLRDGLVVEDRQQ